MSCALHIDMMLTIPNSLASCNAARDSPLEMAVESVGQTDQSYSASLSALWQCFAVWMTGAEY